MEAKKQISDMERERNVLNSWSKDVGRVWPNSGIEESSTTSETRDHIESIQEKTQKEGKLTLSSVAYKRCI